jgi:hypothetical protein
MNLGHLASILMLMGITLTVCLIYIAVKYPPATVLLVAWLIEVYFRLRACR